MTSFVMPFALGYQQQRAYEAIEKPIPTYVLHIIFSNYDDYNFNVHKYQKWSKILNPNY